jgi:hypothetical protein
MKRGEDEEVTPLPTRRVNREETSQVKSSEEDVLLLLRRHRAQPRKRHLPLYHHI